MQVEYRLQIGKDEFVLRSDVADEKDFFEKMSFYSNLPRTGPDGEDDLKIVFRTTTQGHKYYSLISEKAQQEFKFGQNIDTKKGVLFPKGWEPLYKGNDGDTVATGQGATPFSGAATAAPVQQAVTQQTVQSNATTQVSPIQQAPVQQPTPTPQAIQPQIVPQSSPVAPTQVAQPVTSPQQVKSVANDVLARFGIKTSTAGVSQ